MSGDNKGVKRRWWWRWLRVSLIVIGVLFLLLAGTRLFLLYRVRSAISAIRDRGVPATSAELAAMYGPAAGQGAEDSFAEAFKMLRDNEALSEYLGENKLPDPGNPLPLDMKQKLASWLLKNEAAMLLAERSLAKGNCRLPVDLRGAYLGPSDDGVKSLRQIATLFHLRTVMAAEDRQSDVASKAILAQFALARSLGDEALMVRRAMRWGIDWRAVKDIEIALNARILDDRQLVDLDAVVRSEETHDDLIRIMQGERCQGIDLMLMSGGIGPITPFPVAGDSIIERSCDVAGFLQADFLHYFRLMDLLESAARKPYPERVVAARDIMSGWVSGRATYRYFHRFCCSTSPYMAIGFVERSAVVLTYLRCARMAMAAERCRIAHGKWPEQITELTPVYLPEIPRSPFTGKALNYRQWAGNCRVYGPGCDMVDHGGHESPVENRRSDGDIVFSLYAPTTPVPAAKCIVRGKKVIMTNARGVLTGGGEMALSPAGRHLLFLKSADLGSRSEAYLHQPVILDLASGQPADLPVKPMDLSKRSASLWMDNVFSAKGNYVHAFATHVEDSDERTVLYDVNAKTARRFSVPNASCVVSDLDETQIWINERLRNGTKDRAEDRDRKRCRLHMIPLGGGKEEQVTLSGFVPSACSRECLTVISEKDYWSECLLMDLTRGTTIMNLPLVGGAGYWPGPFWAPGGRFFCCRDGGRSACFWDRSRDRLFSLADRIAIAPGPSPHTIFAGEAVYPSQWKEPRLVNLASGQEWELDTKENGDCVCAVGKFIVCTKTEKDGSTTLTLIEIGLE